MARPIEEGLNYFPLDVDIFDDPKLLFVADRFDVKGEIIAIKLLCWIYRNGYYCKWDDEHALIFAKKNFSNIKASLCQDVVSELLKRGFFDEDIFESFGVLTSKAIQSRWQNVIDRSKRKAEIIPEMNLLIQEETPPKKELTLPKTDGSTQSKVKQSKGKESTNPRAKVDQVDLIYQAYPRKVAPKKAKQKIEIALRDVKFDKLLRTVQLYAAAVEGKEKRYIPHPATWFNQGRYDDDPSEWIEEKEEKEPVPKYLTDKL